MHSNFPNENLKYKQNINIKRHKTQGYILKHIPTISY